MSRLDRNLLAAKTMAVEHHLSRMNRALPTEPSGFATNEDAGDIVILNLWQATQIVIDLALGACTHFNLGAPASYKDAFRLLAETKRLDAGVAARLQSACGFRNVVVHGYDRLDFARLHDAARHGPADLRAFLRAMRDLL